MPLTLIVCSGAVASAARVPRGVKDGADAIARRAVAAMPIARMRVRGPIVGMVMVVVIGGSHEGAACLAAQVAP